VTEPHASAIRSEEERAAAPAPPRAESISAPPAGAEGVPAPAPADGDAPEGAPSTRALVRTEDDGWLGRLAGGVVHELKNPISTIHLNLELLREEWGRAWSHSDDPKARRSLKRLDLVLRETRRLDGMLKEFLRFARADRVSPVPVDLGALVDEVMAFVAPEFALRRVEARREVEAGMPEVVADPALVKQAVLNLVQNGLDAIAARAAEAGGEPHERPGGPAGTLTARVLRAPSGREARVEVADTGVGIPAEDLPRLFELYRTTKADGTGLGLATTKRIAEAHGGRVEVESPGPGRGSRFALVLPLAREIGGGGAPCDAAV
jgi:signal transduction histidine kinase